ncbi:MAG: acyl carrier protein [Trebonia sp.]|jgi:acyl carrier protein
MSERAARERVMESIYVVLPEVLAAGPAGRPELSEKTRLMEDLGMTSAAALELMLGLEDVLDIQIDVEEIQPDDMASIGGLAEFIAGQMTVAD